MYDLFLFGYGLTLAINQKLSSLSFITPQQKQILNLDSFFRTFITSGKRERLYRKFIALFRVDTGTTEFHEKMRIKLDTRMDEILENGFERWVGKYLFDPNNQVDSEEKLYLYILHSYWTHLVSEEILHLPKTKKVLAAIADKIFEVICPTGNIFTTNFDTVLDGYLKPQHLHGTTPIPLVSVGEIILEIFPNGKNFEYSYMFGTSGFEKLARLENIRKLSQNKYHLDFFYNPDLALGNLLIYGLSFGKAEAVSDEFLEKYPGHTNFYFVRSIDGHILLKVKRKISEKFTFKNYS